MNVVLMHIYSWHCEGWCSGGWIVCVCSVHMLACCLGVEGVKVCWCVLPQGSGTFA